MKKLKSYELLKLIYDNPEKMIGKEYVQVGGLHNHETNKGDILTIVEFAGITSLALFNGMSYKRINFTGFEEWEEVKQPVPWQEAIEAWINGKEVTCETGGAIHYFTGRYQAVRREQIENGEWHIND